MTKFGQSAHQNRYEFTHHALVRMAQRNLSRSDVLYAIKNGVSLHRDGLLFYFLGQRDLPKGAPHWSHRLEGTTVLLDPWTLTIITVYRNRKALRKIKRKPTYRVNNNHHGHLSYGEATS